MRSLRSRSSFIAVSCSFSFAALLVAAASVAVLGCPPSDYGKRCRIAGDDQTTCGQCIARSCQTALDACCEDTFGCLPRLADVDACSVGQGCAKLYASLPTSSGVTSSPSGVASIASCVKTSCEASCSVEPSSTGSSGSSGAASKTLCQLSDIGCQCVFVTKPSTLPVQNQTSTCGPSDVPKSPGYDAVLCCAGSNWPSEGSCRCTATTSGERCDVTQRNVVRCL